MEKNLLVKNELQELGFTKKHNALINEVTFIEELIKFANHELFENILPPVIVNLENKKGVYGYVSSVKRFMLNDIHYYQMALNMVHLVDDEKGIVPMIDTVLHECIHLYAMEKGIKDVSNNNRYHNKNFKNIAEKIGLKVAMFPTIGYNTLNELSPELVEKLNNQPVLIELAKKITKLKDLKTINQSNISGLGAMFNDSKEVKETKDRNLKSYKCPTCGLKARAKNNAKLICGECMEDMEV